MCCLTVSRSIEKRHGVWAGASVTGVWWIFLQHVSDILWRSTVVAVVALTSYFVGASYFDRKPIKWLKMCGYTRWHWKEQEYSHTCIVLHHLQVGCQFMSRTKQQWVTVVNSWRDKSRYKCGSCCICQESSSRLQTTQIKLECPRNGE